MRNLLCSLSIFALVLIPVFASAGEIPPDHAIFSEKNWIFEKSSENFEVIDYDGSNITYVTFRLYHHPTQAEYTMQEGVVFGETVTRVYYIIDEYNRIFHSAFRLLGQDGVWRGGGIILWPTLLKDFSGKITGARLLMVDEKKETLFFRDVMRK